MQVTSLKQEWCMALAQLVGMLFLTFISHRTPPYTGSERFTDSWRKLMPILHAVITLSTFLLVPVCMIALTLRNPLSAVMLVAPLTQAILLLTWLPLEIWPASKRAYLAWLKTCECLRLKTICRATSFDDLLKSPTAGPKVAQQIT